MPVGTGFADQQRVQIIEAAALWVDGLLNEALDESFPASDPVSSLKFD